MEQTVQTLEQQTTKQKAADQAAPPEGGEEMRPTTKALIDAGMITRSEGGSLQFTSLGTNAFKFMGLLAGRLRAKVGKVSKNSEQLKNVGAVEPKRKAGRPKKVAQKKATRKVASSRKATKEIAKTAEIKNLGRPRKVAAPAAFSRPVNKPSLLELIERKRAGKVFNHRLTVIKNEDDAQAFVSELGKNGIEAEMLRTTPYHKAKNYQGVRFAIKIRYSDLDPAQTVLNSFKASSEVKSARS